MKKPQKKQILFALIIVVVVGVSATTAILVSQYQASIRPPVIKAPVAVSPKQVIQEKSHDAEKKAYEGDVDGGVKALDKAIESTNDTHEKYMFHSSKATLLYNNKDLSGALAAAIKAYELEKSSDSAALVGQFSRESGNKAQAIEYYKKAVASVDKNDPYWDEDTAYYQSLITEIEGEANNG